MGASRHFLALNSFSAVLGTVFFFRVGLDRDSIFTGLHGIFWAGLGTHGTPHRRTGLSTSGDSMAFLGGTRYPRDNTGPGSILMGVHGRFYAGFSNHGTPIVLSTTAVQKMATRTVQTPAITYCRYDTPQREHTTKEDGVRSVPGM